MNKFHSLSVAASLALVVLTGASGSGSAHAGELFEPQNSDLTQSVLAPGSRFFISIDDETAVTANERYVSNPAEGPTLFATTDRQEIAKWLAWAERKRSLSPIPLTLPGAPAALQDLSQPAIQHANAKPVNVPLRATYSIGQYYAN